MLCPFNMLIAFSASTWLLISTKAKPFDWPLSRSLISATEATVPACPKRFRRSSSVVEYDKFPTYNLDSIFLLRTTPAVERASDKSGVRRPQKRITKPCDGKLSITWHLEEEIRLKAIIRSPYNP